jgi:hypothetical protein
MLEISRRFNAKLEKVFCRFVDDAESLGFWTCPSSGILKNCKRKFWKLDLFPASGEGKVTSTLLGPLE